MEPVSYYKLFKCSICSSGFHVGGHKSVSDDKKPFVLHCGHSVCKECLSTTLSSKYDITCLVCKGVSSVPSSFTLDDLSQYFPLNYYLLGLLITNSPVAKVNDLDSSIKFSKPKLGSKRLKSVICSECAESSAESLCKQCSAPYCDVCFKMIHATARSLRSHTKVALLESYLGIEADKPLMCSVHEGSRLEFYCFQCRVPSCPRCMVENHQGHNIDLLENLKENCEEEFLDRYVKVANVLQRMKTSYKRAEYILSKGQEKVKPLKLLHDQICEAFAFLTGKLIALQNKMHCQLHQADNCHLLKSVMNELNESINTTESLLISTKVLLRDPNLQKPNILVAVIDNLKKKEELPCFLIEEQESSDVPKFEINEALVKELDNLCHMDVTGNLRYKLVTESNLPSGYEIQSVNEVTREEVISMMENSVAESEVSSVCSDSFSDKVIIGEQSVETSSPSSSQSSVSHKLKKKCLPPSYPEELTIGCQVRVILCHLVSPSDFYVQRECAVKKLADFQASLKPGSLNHQKPPSKLMKGQIYLVLYVKDSKWYRARIIEIFVEDNTKYKVLYIDFGNTEIVTRNRIRSLPNDVVSIPVLAIRCKLNNCVPKDEGEWNPQAIALMAKIIDNDYMTMIVKDKTPISYIVDLYKITECNVINIQHALCFLEYASAASECEWNTAPALLYTPSELRLPKEKYNLGDIYEVHVSYVVSPFEFYAQNLNSSKRLIKMTDELHRTCNSINDSKYTVYHPRKGMYVVARYSRDKRWYRGVIKDCLQNKLMRVFFIDFGGEEEVHWDNVRLLHSRFSKVPPQAIKCTLSDVLPADQDDWSLETCIYFRNLIFNKKLKLVVHQIHEEGHLNVVLYYDSSKEDICINSLLVKDGKAISTGPNSIDEEPLHILSDFSCETKSSVERPKVLSQQILEEPVVKADDAQILSDVVKGPDGTMRTHVLVKRIVTPGEFYVTLFSFNESQIVLAANLQKHYNTVECTQKDWEIDSVCAVKFNNKWFRALVLEKLTDDRYRMNLVDEGIEAILTSDSICHLDEKFTALQDGVIRCHLGGLDPPLSGGWSNSSVQELEEFVNSHKELIYISKLGALKNSSMPVELFARLEKEVGPTEPLSYEWKSFNHFLRLIGLAKSDEFVQWDCDGNILNREVFDKCSDKDDSEVLDNMFSKSLKVSSESPSSVSGSGFLRIGNESSTESPEMVLTDVEKNTEAISVPCSWIPAVPLENLEIIATVTYIDEDLNIYFHDFHKNGSILDNISQIISMKYRGTLPKPSDATLKKGDLCVVLYHGDNCWYRASVLKANPECDEYEILCVDYGNVEMCKLAELRKNAICHNHPIQMSKGKLVSVEPVHADGKWKKREIELVHLTIVGNHCQLELERIPDKASEYIIKKLILPDGNSLVSWMVKNDLAIFKEQYIYKNAIEIKENINGEIEKIEDLAESAAILKDSVSGDLKPEEKREQFLPKGEEQLEAPKPPEMDWFMTAETELNNDFKNKVSEEFSEEEMEVAEHVSPLNNFNPAGENQIFHWSFFQNERENSIKYRELEIPDSVNMLLVQATAYHSSTVLVLHVCDVMDDSEILENIEKFKELSQKLQEEGPLQPVLSEPFKYKACCAQFSGDGQWYRAFVLDTISNNELIIQFVDFGNVEVCPSSRVRKLKEEWGELGVFGLLCELNDITIPKESIDPDIILDSLKDALEVGEGMLRAIIKVKKPNVLKVDIFRGDSLAYEDLIEKHMFIYS